MRHPKTNLVATSVMKVCLASIAFADTLLVPSETYPTIQSAIDTANDGDEIVVAPGTYHKTISLLGKAITLRGSDGADVTIIDGTGLNDSVVKCVTGEGPATVLEGFTITGGTGDSSSGSRRGGGMYIFQSSPTVAKCRFEGNDAYRGGGVSLLESQATINDCHFENNTAEYGGGLYLGGSDATVQQCTFLNNTGDGGGGMTTVDSDPMISGCLFDDNHAVEDGFIIFGTGGGALVVRGRPTFDQCQFLRNDASDGGAIFSRETTVIITGCSFSSNRAKFGGAMASELSFVNVTDSMFSSNRADFWGGAIDDTASRLTLERSYLGSNIAGQEGGAVYLFASGPTVFRNTIFRANSGGDVGGAIACLEDSQIAIEHCTFRDNRASTADGISLGDPDGILGGSDLTITNSILSDGGDEIQVFADATVSVTYSNVQGSFPGAGNINAFPRFLGLDDLRLLPNSPGINAGAPDFLPQADETDIDGNPRLQGCRTDMGAYESPIQQVVGDFDGNRYVDLKDFAAFQQCMGGVSGSSAWADACVCAFNAGADGAIGSADFADFPARMGNARQPPPRIDRLVPPPGEWVVNDVGLQEVQIGFDEAVLVPPDAIDVWTVGGGTVSDFAIVYDSLTNVLTVRFASPLRDDRVTVVVDYVVTGLTGTELDGEIFDPLNAALPSGDGWPGGQGVFRIHVLRGDVTRDGRVDDADLDSVAQSLGSCTGDPGFDANADLTADGCVDKADENIVIAALGRQLPATDGVPPTVTSIETSGPFGSFDTAVVRFSELYMPLSRIDQRTCFLADPDGNVLVPIVAESSGFGNALIFRFEPGFPSCDGYSINISNEVSDSSGELLVTQEPAMCP